MTVVKCGTCKNNHVRFGGDQIPPPYCSWECWWNRRRTQAKDPHQAKLPRDVLAKIRKHLSNVHATADPTAWFPECRTCEQLQDQYAIALSEALESVA